ncbi:PhzF family phenazine biosynthesis protein [Candidatus Gottesmanbacteria bacterium]|nr:PhzF family phenazine biosynthesis protein [Candidatus Gottesmanbacteria bacterium]
MIKGIAIHILRVFVNGEGKFGNPVGIIVDEHKEVSPKDRQKISTYLGFSESVFLNNVDTGEVSIFNPKREVDFAGHALVGTAYFITKVLGKPITFLTCRAGRVLTWQENELTWIQARLKNTPPWHHEQLQDARSVDSLSLLPKEHMMVWVWLDKDKGIVRARTFAPDWGIPEDEANGSGSMQLAAILGKKLEIHHGKGSIIYAKPAGTGLADVGGRVAEEASMV